MIKNVLFDLDGTLVDSTAGITNSLAYAINKPLKPSDIRDTVSHGAKECISACAPEENIEQAHQRFLSHYNTHLQHNVSLFAHALEVIKALNDANINLGIVTNKSQILSQRTLKIAKIYHFFPWVITPEMAQKKPSGEGIKLAMSCMDAQASETLYIGDDAVDYYAAKEAKCHFLFADYGYGELPADVEVKRIDNLQAVLAFVL